MPIIIATCTECNHQIEIDTTRAVVLTGTDETIWRTIRHYYRAGQTINVQFVADHTFTGAMTVRRSLNHFALMGLIRRPLKRPDGVYRHYVLPPIPQIQQFAA